MGVLLSRCWELNPESLLYESIALPLSYIGRLWRQFILAFLFFANQIIPSQIIIIEINQIINLKAEPKI